MAPGPTHARRSLHRRRLAWLALVLTWVGGFVDAVGFLTLDRIYTANMSGNSVSVGIGWSEANWAEAARRGWPVLMFVLGLLLSAVILESAKRKGIRPRYSIPLALEEVLLLAFVVWGTRSIHGGEVRPSSQSLFFCLVALPSLAMGLQNATLTRVGALSVHTTHVTGGLTTFARDFSSYIFWLYDQVRRRAWPDVGSAWKASRERGDLNKAALAALLWIAFVFGGAAGAYLRVLWGLEALIPLCVILAIVIAFDIARPLSHDPLPDE